MSTRFEMRGGLGLDELSMGPWVEKPRARPERADSAQAGPMSFGAAYDDDGDDGDDDALGAEAPLWQVDLDPGNLAQAHAEFDRGEMSVAHTEAQLSSVLGRIDRAMRVGAAQPDGHAAPVIDARVPDAEAELLFEMDGLRHPQAQAQATGVGPVSFGVVGDSWDAMVAKAKKTMESVLRVATYPSWVETRIAGHLLARSAITWTGDTLNVGAPYLTPDLIRIHTRSVNISIRTRNAWTRLLVVVVQGSSRIAASAGPTGAAMALPMAWSFVRRVLAEVKHLRTIQKSG